MPTFLQIQTRYMYLRGENDVATITDVDKSHLNYAIKDILNAFPFSWSLNTTTLTLSAGTASLPSDFNPIWGIYDARVSTAGQGNDNVFELIDVKDRDYFGSIDYNYWLTNSSGTYTFNTPIQTGTVTIYYYSLPTDLSGTTDNCIVPDGEAVAYLAASKMWIGDERNQALKVDYEKEAESRIQDMYNRDLNFGPKIYESSLPSENSVLNSRGV